MFQNLGGQVVENEYDDSIVKDDRIKVFLKNSFTVQKIVLYILSFMISTLSGISGVAPFALSIFAAVLSNKIPALIVYILTLLGTLIGLGPGQALIYLLTSLVFIVMTLIFKPRENNEYENEKLKLGRYVFLSSLIVQIVNCFLNGVLVYDVLLSIGIAISAYIFYKIFANSIILISEYGIKSAFAIEEVIGASIMLAICASSFRGMNIFGFEIKTILNILIILILGWKNGILVGATSGVTIGTILALTNSESDPVMIAAFAISRMYCRSIFKASEN